MNRKDAYRWLAAITAALLLALPISGEETARKVDELFKRWDRSDSPGCALAVIQDGEIIYQHGYGMANLELGVPITPDSVFYCGSVSKQFVAMCIALLIKEGRLSLEDDIRTYLPEMPDYGTPVRIKHLVYHTSGIRDYLTLEGIAGIPFGNYHENDVLQLITKQRGLNFKPGDEYLYSNSGYFLLAVIVKRASGDSLREYAHEHIFAPLGMNNTHFHDDFRRLIKNRASGYLQRGKDRYMNFLSTFDLVGSGGLYSSVKDLLLWDQNFYHFQVGGRDTHQLMLTTGMLNDGKSLDYAFAVEIQNYRGLETIGHGGALGGYRAGYVQFPKLKFSVIVLANIDTFDAMNFCYRIAEIYLGDMMSDAPSPQGPQKRPGRASSDFHPTRTQLAEYQGDYFCRDLEVVYSLVVEKDKLTFKHNGAPAGYLVPRDNDTFHIGNITLRFERGPEGRITSFLLDAGRVRDLPFHKRD